MGEAARKPSTTPRCADPADLTLHSARSILLEESAAIQRFAGRLDRSFAAAIDLMFGRRGAIIVMGMGKAGLVGQKIAATLASTGSRSHFVHPAEAVHGDLGRISKDDVVLMLSFSGETAETVQLLPLFQQRQIPIVALTGNATSRLAQAATLVIDMGAIKEVGSLGLAPTASTTVMLAAGDALAVLLSERREFRPDDFAQYHPGGSLGQKLARVEDVMRPLASCRSASAADTLRNVLSQSAGATRRSGAVLLVDANGQLQGIFTDSDLARLLSNQGEALLDRPIRETMSTSPCTVEVGTMLTVAVELLAQRKISELPIVDTGRLVGMIDITDVIELLPKDFPGPSASDFDRPRILPFSTSTDRTDS